MEVKLTDPQTLTWILPNNTHSWMFVMPQRSHDPLIHWMLVSCLRQSKSVHMLSDSLADKGPVARLTKMACGDYKKEKLEAE